MKMQKELELFNRSFLDEDSSSPKLLLILDTETTGLEPETDQCIEVGSILFHVESRSILAQNSFLIPSSSNSAEAINKIGIAVDIIPTPKPAIIVVAAPVSDCFTIEFTGFVPVPV